MNVKLTKSEKTKVLNSTNVYSIMQRILRREDKIGRDKEHFWIICLSNDNRILLIELISLGTVNRTLIEPMEVFSFALQKRAVKIIMVHNHPSGNLKPSSQDQEITEKMFAIAEFVNIPIIDHLIISTRKYFSFLDAGLMDKIRAGNKYDLGFNKVDNLLKKLKRTEREIERLKERKEPRRS